MNFENQKILKKLIVAYSAYYNRELSDDVIKMYIEDLSEFDLTEIVDAFKKYRNDAKNRQMFLPAQIKEIISPIVEKKDLAISTALRVKEAIYKYGWSNENEAKIFIGPAGWKMIDRFGGWKYVCENLGINLMEGQFFAQFRDAIESNLKLNQAGINTELPSIEQSSYAGQIKQITNRLIKKHDI